MYDEREHPCAACITVGGSGPHGLCAPGGQMAFWSICLKPHVKHGPVCEYYRWEGVNCEETRRMIRGDLRTPVHVTVCYLG